MAKHKDISDKDIGDLEAFIKSASKYQERQDKSGYIEWKTPTEIKKRKKKKVPTKEQLKEEVRKLNLQLKSEKSAKTRLKNKLEKEIKRLKESNKRFGERINKLNKFNRFDIIDLEDN